jgi:hypothetical protein
MTESSKPELPFLPIAINTIVGVTLSAGVLAIGYGKSSVQNSDILYLGVIVMLPTAFISPSQNKSSPVFDKNDLSHVLLTAGIIYFYIGIRKSQMRILSLKQLKIDS